MSSPEKFAALTELVMDALASTIAKDADRAANKLIEIGSQCTDSEMYGVCCALAAAGQQALTKIYGPDFNRAGGDMFALHELKPGTTEPEEMFAMRFLVAYANDDKPTCMALYSAATKASDEDFVGSVSALLINVAGLSRLALDRT
ncbi:hypothetical protein ACIPJK_07450 [Streptomyces roseus]|uniref:hypothetical protein n=1 Tax=Streptomyces roseus TaxID=66430 RepID=UPI0038019977